MLPGKSIMDKGMRNIELECKKICVLRCAYAIAYSVAFQYFLLAIYLLFVNFKLFHPIAWILSTLSLICSFYTWLCLMPLLIFVVIYGLLLAHFHFRTNVYYATRFIKIWKTTLPKIIFMLIHVIVGFLTAWLYTKFLALEYGRFYRTCFEDNYCINERYACLILMGLFTSFYYFVQERLKISPTIKFPLIKQSIYLEIRSHLNAIVYESFAKCILPSLVYIFGYYICGSLIRSCLSNLFLRQIDNNISPFDIRLIFYAWLISSQILTNMRLMDFLFVVFLTDYKEFSIEQSSIVEQQHELTLVEALSCTKMPIIQELASLDLYTLANQVDKSRRTQLFALSIPGGHPYCWKAIRTQCLNIIDGYRENLNKLTANIVRTNPIPMPVNGPQLLLRPSATEFADKIRYRQYNETFGIRNMSMQIIDNESEIPTKSKLTQQFDDVSTLVSTKYFALKKTIQQIPGIYYLFGESDIENICFLLSRYQFIGWTCQGLAALAAHSLAEDRYGVVQDDLQTIIVSLLKLKQILDKVCTINFGEKSHHYHSIALRNSVRRSIYHVCTVFADYMPDILADPSDLRIIQNYLIYKEI